MLRGFWNKDSMWEESQLTAEPLSGLISLVLTEKIMVIIIIHSRLNHSNDNIEDS